MKTEIKSIDDVITHKGEDWRNVLLHAREIIPEKYLSTKNLVRLTKGAATIEQTKVLIELLEIDFKDRPAGANGIDIFFRVVDHSNYSLGSWLAGIVYFTEWLSSQNRTTSFQKMLGFLQCCEEAPENKEVDYRFIDLIEDMLKNYGYVD